MHKSLPNSTDIKKFLENKLAGCESTFKETSLDGTIPYNMCEDERTLVYDFDKYIRENYDLSMLPSSPDAIYLDNNKFYFVEFKNSPLYNVDHEVIKNKFQCGTEILKELLRDFIPNDHEFIFCVVYRQEKSRYFSPLSIMSNMTKFGLESVNDGFYNKIITQDIDFYKSEFNQFDC